MKFTVTFASAWIINILLFLAMTHLITTDRKKEWIRTTSGDFFNFVRQPPKTELIPRRPVKTPPKPESEPESTAFSEPVSHSVPAAADMRALPLPVAALKVDIPLSSINLGAGPTLPSVVTSGSGQTGRLGQVPSSGSGTYYGTARPSFIMADELTAIMKAQPVYPQKLKFRRIQGEVLIEFTVTQEGKVSDLKVIKSSPAGAFDRVSLRAIRRWRFQPKTNEEGQPVPVRARQHFVFKLY